MAFVSADGVVNADGVPYGLCGPDAARLMSLHRPVRARKLMDFVIREALSAQHRWPNIDDPEQFLTRAGVDLDVPATWNMNWPDGPIGRAISILRAQFPISDSESSEDSGTDLCTLVLRHHTEAARGLPARSDVLSDFNLGAFMSWLARSDPVRARVYIQECPIFNHGDSMPGITVLDPSVRLLDGRSHTLRSIPCTTPMCDRCRSGRGGYRFHYVGPWTCLNSFGDALMDKSPAGARAAWLSCQSCPACLERQAQRSLASPFRPAHPGS